MGNLCIFCGGEELGPEHQKYCDGRQGKVEAETHCDHKFVDSNACLKCGWVPDAPPAMPMLISGLADATWDTSASAAISVEAERDTQRELVFTAIRDARWQGRTDDELQVLLDLDGSSERPRRWELWKVERICILRDEHGDAVKRLTRTNRRAVVWIATELLESEVA